MNGHELLNEELAVDLVMRLMQIEGISCQEKLIAQAVLDTLTSNGANPADIVFDDAHTRTPSKGEVGNLVFRLGQELDGPPLLLSAHIDTVPVCIGSKPVRNGDLITSDDPETGLGADNRAGTAILLNTATALLSSQRIVRPVTFCFFVQEEIGLQGSHYADPTIFGNPQVAVNFDGSYVDKLTIGATSGEKISIVVHGKASHAGIAPEQGVSAIAIAAKAITELTDKGWLGLVEKQGQRGTSNCGVIGGGSATNVITPKVEIKAEARSLNSEFRQQIIREIRQAFENAAKSTVSSHGECGQIEFSTRLDYEAFQLDENSPSVVEASAAVKRLGRTPELTVSNGGLDANWLYQHGVPAVTVGCGQRNVHTTGEQLVVSDYLDACRLALDLATQKA